MEKIIFLDRDGTINKEINYLYKQADLEILPGVPEAIKMLRESGYRIVVVTNQAGVARGYYQEADVEHLHQYLNQQLAKAGAKIDHFFYCPHHPEHGIGDYKIDCPCRKPAAGMLKRAEKYYFVDKANSFIIGDKLLDIRAGNRYGVRGILVGTGYGSQEHRMVMSRGQTKEYEYFAKDLMAAAQYIIDPQRKGE